MTQPHVSSVPLEARPFQGRTAGLVSRSLAAVVDLAVVATVMLATYLGLNGLLFLIDPRGFSFRATHLLLSVAVALGIAIVYLTGCWALIGRSYGCHVMGLSVVDRRGRRPRLWTALLRAVLCVVAPVGLLWCGWSRTNRSFQDVLLGTRVVYDWIPHPVPEVPRPRSSSEDEVAPARQDDAGGSL